MANYNIGLTVNHNRSPMNYKNSKQVKDKSLSMEKSLSKKQRNETFFKNAKNKDIIKIN